MDKISRRSSKKKAGAKKASAGKKAKAEERLRNLEVLKTKPPDTRGYKEWVRDLEAGDMESYLRLRQVLDSFHYAVIYYYAMGENSRDRDERQQRVKQHFDSFLQQVLNEQNLNLDCPAGTRPCPGGGCIPVCQPCL